MKFLYTWVSMLLAAKLLSNDDFFKPIIEEYNIELLIFTCIVGFIIQFFHNDLITWLYKIRILRFREKKQIPVVEEPAQSNEVIEYVMPLSDKVEKLVKLCKLKGYILSEQIRLLDEMGKYKLNELKDKGEDIKQYPNDLIDFLYVYYIENSNKRDDFVSLKNVIVNIDNDHNKIDNVVNESFNGLVKMFNIESMDHVKQMEYITLLSKLVYPNKKHFRLEELYDSYEMNNFDDEMLSKFKDSILIHKQPVEDIISGKSLLIDGKVITKEAYDLQIKEEERLEEERERRKYEWQYDDQYGGKIRYEYNKHWRYISILMVFAGLYGIHELLGPSNDARLLMFMVFGGPVAFFLMLVGSLFDRDGYYNEDGRLVQHKTLQQDRRYYKELDAENKRLEEEEQRRQSEINELKRMEEDYLYRYGTGFDKGRIFLKRNPVLAGMILAHVGNQLNKGKGLNEIVSDVVKQHPYLSTAAIYYLLKK